MHNCKNVGDRFVANKFKNRIWSLNDDFSRSIKI